MAKKRTLAEVLADDTLSDKDKYHWYVERSDEWKAVREQVLARDGHKCRCCCREDKLTVHHANYSHLFHEADNDYADLITLCSVCHRAIHTAKSNLGRFRQMKENKE